jgi:hypothetical protein
MISSFVKIPTKVTETVYQEPMRISARTSNVTRIVQNVQLRAKLARSRICCIATDNADRSCHRADINCSIQIADGPPVCSNQFRVKQNKIHENTLQARNMSRTAVADGSKAQVVCTVQACCLEDKYATVAGVPELVHCAYIS